MGNGTLNGSKMVEKGRERDVPACGRDVQGPTNFRKGDCGRWRRGVSVEGSPAAGL